MPQCAGMGGGQYAEVVERLNADIATELAAAVMDGRKQLAEREAAFERFLRSLGLRGRCGSGV